MTEAAIVVTVFVLGVALTIFGATSYGWLYLLVGVVMILTSLGIIIAGAEQQRILAQHACDARKGTFISTRDGDWCVASLPPSQP